MLFTAEKLHFLQRISPLDNILEQSSPRVNRLEKPSAADFLFVPPLRTSREIVSREASSRRFSEIVLATKGVSGSVVRDTKRCPG